MASSAVSLSSTVHSRKAVPLCLESPIVNHLNQTGSVMRLFSLRCCLPVSRFFFDPARPIWYHLWSELHDLRVRNSRQVNAHHAHPSSRRIYAPAIELPEAERCEIVLNSRSPNPIDVTPIFYTIDGDAVVGNSVQLQPAEMRFVPVEQLMPEALRGRHRWGGIALSFSGGVMEVWSQITFHGVGGGSVDETFNILEEPGSDTREAVWLMPKKSTAVIALGNSSNVGIRTTAQFADGDSEDVDIPAGVTKFIRRHARERDIESVKLSAAGPAGSMRVMGFVVADDQNFTSSIRFYDTMRTVQPNLYATNLRLKNTVPRVVLKNTSQLDTSARLRFFSAAGEQYNPVELPTVTVRPQQVVDVDLSALREAAASRTDLESVSVQVLNNGAPGSLIGAAYSRERASQLVYDVPLRDSGKTRNGTGSYPWRVDEDYSTVVAITNIGNDPAPFQVEIRYPGGPYSLGRRNWLWARRRRLTCVECAINSSRTDWGEHYPGT
jgi:hypothetical protein